MAVEEEAVIEAEAAAAASVEALADSEEEEEAIVAAAAEDSGRVVVASATEAVDLVIEVEDVADFVVRAALPAEAETGAEAAAQGAEVRREEAEAAAA